MLKLIEELIKKGYLKTPAIIDAFKKINRADFVLPGMESEVMENIPLSIGYGQTISQPLTVALMLELLQPKKDDKVLDIGSGSGWTTALLAEIVGSEGKVFAIERIPELKEFGENNVRKYDFVASKRAIFITGDGSKGLADEAPFDKIHVGAAAAQIPDELKNQLVIGGRLVAPEGIDMQDLVLIQRTAANEFKEQRWPGFVFVPLISKE